MFITLYHLDKRPNSLKIPNTEGERLEVQLKTATSKYSPSFYLKTIKPEWNYLKYDDLFYYIEDVVTLNTNYFQIICSIDVLASYRNEILNTRVYVKYSTSDYDIQIPDERVSVGSDVLYAAKNVNPFAGNGPYLMSSDYSGSRTHGTYVVQYVTTEPTLGTSGCLWLDPPNIKALVNLLNDGSFLQSMFNVDLGQLVSKNLNNVYECILGCRYIPFYLFEFTPPEMVNIKLGNYQTKIHGFKPDTAVVKYVDIEIPRLYDDFRQLSPYSDYYISLPGVGIVPYNANLLVNRQKLRIELILDGITGDVKYTIDDTTVLSGNIATELTMSKTSASNVGAGLLSIGTAVGAAATGHLGIAAGALFGATLTNAEVSTGSIGGFGSFINAFTSGVSSGPGEISIVCLSRGTNTEPATMAEVYGRPLNQTMMLTSLTGYCQTTSASVICDAPFDIKTQINDYLDGGIYIE